MKHAFDGIKVVELGGYIVSGYCTFFLADLGAEVIKIESLQGDGLRPQVSFQAWNRGKRGIAVNLRSEEGKKILYQLVEQADVLVQNLRVGVAERWGADYATLSSLNPRLIYCAMPGYGQSGPYAQRPAFDPVLQAQSGAMAAQGGPGSPPVFYRVPMSDNAGAMLGAYGVALALYQRVKTGKGQYIHGALLNAAIAVQSGEFISYPGKPEEPRMDYWGRDAIYRLYKTEDGWLFLGCDNESSWQSLCRALGREELINAAEFATPFSRQANAAHLAQILATIFLRDSLQYWLNLLEKAGVPCAPVSSSRALFDHPHVLENDLIAEHESGDLGPLKQVGMVVKLSKTPGKLGSGAPSLGQHTNEVLSELGYSKEDIQQLREKQAIG